MVRLRKYSPQVYMNYLLIAKRIRATRLDSDILDLDEKRGILREIGIKGVKIRKETYSLDKCRGNYLRAGIMRRWGGILRYLEAYQGRFEGDKKEGRLEGLFIGQKTFEYDEFISTNPELLNKRGVPLNLRRGIFSSSKC